MTDSPALTVAESQAIRYQELAKRYDPDCDCKTCELLGMYVKMPVRQQ